MRIKWQYIFIVILTCSTKLNAQNSLTKPMIALPIDSLKKLPLRVLAANYYSSNLPFFCRKELQIQKITQMPVKFRIGSLDEVDRLEGKHKSRP
jgi:hypothetical protein